MSRSKLHLLGASGLLVLLAGCELTFEPELSPTLTPVAQAEVLLGELQRPGAIVEIPGGYALAEAGSGEILELDGELELRGSIGSNFDGPDLLAAAGDLLVVSDSADPSIWQLELDGSGAAELWAGEEAPTALRLEAGRAWFTAPEGAPSEAALRWADLGTEELGLVTDELVDPTGFVLVGDEVFLADPGRGELLSIDTVTGAAVSLSDPFEDPRDVAWDEGELFFTARSPRWPGGGWVYRLDDLGGSPTQLSYSPPGIDQLVLTDDFVYWSSSQSITRAPRDGGTYEVLATETRVGGFLVVGERLVWTDRDRGQLLSVPLGD